MQELHDKVQQMQKPEEEAEEIETSQENKHIVQINPEKKDDNN